MNDYVNYFVESNLSLCFLLMVYRLFLQAHFPEMLPQSCVKEKSPIIRHEHASRYHFVDVLVGTFDRHGLVQFVDPDLSEIVCSES
jgi:hypothetical protein